MKPLKTRIKYIVNFISYLQISLSLLLILYFSYTSTPIHRFTFLNQNDEIVILYHKNYKQLTQQDTIYYYNKGKITQQNIKTIIPSKYQIHLQDDSYTTPSHYIGHTLYTIPLTIPLSQLTAFLGITLSLAIMVLIILLKRISQPNQP